MTGSFPIFPSKVFFFYCWTRAWLCNASPRLKNKDSEWARVGHGAILLINWSPSAYFVKERRLSFGLSSFKAQKCPNFFQPHELGFCPKFLMPNRLGLWPTIKKTKSTPLLKKIKLPAHEAFIFSSGHITLSFYICKAKPQRGNDQNLSRQH